MNANESDQSDHEELALENLADRIKKRGSRGKKTTKDAPEDPSPKKPKTIVEDPPVPPVQPVQPPVPKTKAEIKLQIEDRGENLLTVLCVESEENEGEKLSEAARRNMYRHAKLTEDTIPKHEYLLPSGKKMPDHHNYRRLTSFFDSRVTPTPSKSLQKPQPRSQKTNDELLKLRLTGEMFFDPLKTSGKKITELALKSAKDNVNRAFSTAKKDLPNENVDLATEELEHIIKKLGYTGHKNLKGEDRLNVAPTRVIHVKDKKELESKEFQDRVLSSSIVLIKNVGDIIDFDKELFSVQTIRKTDPNVEIPCLSELPQQSNSNVSLSTGQEIWRPTFKTVRVKFDDFADYHDALKAASSDAFNVLKNPKATEANFKAAKGKVEAACRDKGKIWFGTNYDLLEDKHPKQFEELKKFPECMRPLGKDDMLHHLGENIPGISSAQIYFKNPGSRTYGHLENSNLCSFNINLGPAPCIWYAVSFEFAQKMVALLNKKNQRIYSGFWLNEETMKKFNIPLQKFVQEPGDIVVVGPGTFHWVTCPGFAVNVAWNMAPPTKSQLCCTAVLYDDLFDSNAKIEVLVPVVPMILSLAKERKFLDDEEMFPPMKHLLARYLAFSQIELAVLKELESTKKMAPVLITEEDDWAKGVLRCSKQPCYQVLNNTVLKKKTGEVICVRCFNKMPRNSTYTIFIRDEISKLVKIFDQYSQ